MFSSIFRVKFNGLLCFAMLLKPIVALHIMNFLKLSKLLGGGGSITICLPPPPPPESTPLGTEFVMCYLIKSLIMLISQDIFRIY